MANTIPTLWPSPDAALFPPLSFTYSREAKKIGQAINALKARPIVLAQQNWHPLGIGGDAPAFARKTNAWSAAGQVVYRIPRIPWRADVSLAAYVVVPAGGGQIRMKSATTGVTVTSALAAGAQWVQPGTALAVGTAGGYDDVEVYTRGDGSDPLVVEHLTLEHKPAASPLGAPGSSTVVPFDADELDDDEPLSADTAQSWRTSLATMLERVSRHITWSGLNDVDDSSVGPAEMPSWSHRVWSRAVLGARREESKVRVWALATNAGGDDAAIYLDAGGNHVNGSAQFRHEIVVPAGTVSPTWFSADVWLDEGVPLRATVPYPLCSFRTRGLPVGGAPDGSYNTASLLSLSAWGI